jgi:hypothetical protein
MGNIKTERRKAVKTRPDKGHRKKVTKAVIEACKKGKATQIANWDLLREKFLEIYLEFGGKVADVCAELGISENTAYGWICDPAKSSPEWKERFAVLKTIKMAKKSDNIEDFMADVADGTIATGKDTPVNMPNVSAGTFMLKGLKRDVYGDKPQQETRTTQIKVIEYNRIEGTEKTTEEITIETKAQKQPELPEHCISEVEYQCQ